MPTPLRNIDYGSRYSADRLYLAQEIRNVLASRGYKVPPDWASDDLVTAVDSALAKCEHHIDLLIDDLPLKSAS